MTSKILKSIPNKVYPLYGATLNAFLKQKMDVYAQKQTTAA